MREILFRGKDIQGEWIEGKLLYFKANVGTDELAIIVAGCEWDNSKEWFNLGKRAYVIPETIGQYTGLTDKNGKKIFEGDIVKHSIGTFVVKFLNGTFCCSLIEDDYLTDLCSIHNQCEIIGNIHDNPELLKGE